MIPTLYACDPGFSKSNATGRAEFINGRLVACGAIAPKGETYVERIEEIAAWALYPTFLNAVPAFIAPARPIVDVLVIENPKIYPGPQQKGDPDDVVLLATLVGMIAGRVPHRELQLPRPQQWKGNVPKDIMLKRIDARLEPDEKAVLEAAKGKRDAILDAIGIGLHVLSRLR